MVKIPFQLQKRRKNDPKISNFYNFSNDLKNVSKHCGGHYNIKIKHFEHFSGETPGVPPSCQGGLIQVLEDEKNHSHKNLGGCIFAICPFLAPTIQFGMEFLCLPQDHLNFFLFWREHSPVSGKQ